MAQSMNAVEIQHPLHRILVALRSTSGSNFRWTARWKIFMISR
jgi:hypothetical protein